MPRSLEGRARGVPDGDVRPREFPVPDFLGVEGLECATAGQREVDRVRKYPQRQREQPQRLAADLVANPRDSPQACGEVGRAVLSRTIEVEDRDRNHQDQAGAARGARERPKHPYPRPAALARTPEDSDRERQVQRSE